MGISQLNMYLNKHCGECITTQPLSSLKNKKMAIDVQIYLYSFLCAVNGSLMENMYKMCLQFKTHEMIPIFVFDNRSKKNVENHNKMDIRKQRKENRNLVFQELRNDATDKVISDAKLQTLKRQIVRVTDAQIVKIKELIVSFGFTCLDAEEEADEICAHICMTNKGCGCFSDDTDMLVYGCANVYRNLNLEDNTVSWINVTSVLKKLNMSQNEFRQVCALAKNDYNCSQENVSTIHHVMDQFQLYKNSPDNDNNDEDFYKFFLQKDLQLNQEFQRIYNIFDVYARPQALPKITFSNKTTNYNQLQNIMESDGFHYMGSNNFG